MNRLDFYSVLYYLYIYKMQKSATFKTDMYYYYCHRLKVQHLKKMPLNFPRIHYMDKKHTVIMFQDLVPCMNISEIGRLLLACGTPVKNLYDTERLIEYILSNQFKTRKLVDYIQVN